MSKPSILSALYFVTNISSAKAKQFCSISCREVGPPEAGTSDQSILASIKSTSYLPTPVVIAGICVITFCCYCWPKSDDGYESDDEGGSSGNGGTPDDPTQALGVEMITVEIAS